MGKLISTGGALFVYLCVATVLTAAIVFGYLWTHGVLDEEKLDRMAAVARGTEPVAQAVEQVAKAPQAAEQPSLDEVERQRAIQSRQLELREQAIDSNLDRVRFEQRKLTDERAQYELLKTGFEKVLDERRNKAIVDGRENMQLIWENIKPKQAKEEILAMIDAGEQNEVVAILSGITITKRARIIGEFKTPDEAKKLEEILRLIREGIPDITSINQTQQELKKFNPQQK
ncbi:MAG TPA: hypothetical protein VHX65_07235 [Pirellulales bacterium]|jgi:hypothetical protein|nr:hypothetical protein [Pirellulales bacterium]